MDNQFKILQDSVSLTAKSIEYVANNESGEKALLLKSCCDSLQALKTYIEALSISYETEKSIKNRCFSFLGEKGLISEFYGN